MATLKVSKVSSSGSDLQLPSHVSLVGGLDDYTAAQLAEFKNTTLTSAINALSDVYLGKTAKAADAAQADKATKDGSGRVITTTYYTTNTTVANAAYATKAYKDSNDNVIVDKYAQTNGSYAQLKAGFASDCTAAQTAVSIAGGGGNINACFNVASINANNRLTLKRANGAEVNLDIANLAHSDATSLAAGFMSAADKTKLDTIDEHAQSFQFLTTGTDDLNLVLKPGAYRFTRLNSSMHHVPLYFAHSNATSYMIVFNTMQVEPYNGTVVQMLWNVGGNNFWYRVFSAYEEAGTAGYERRWYRLTSELDDSFANSEDPVV